MDLKKIKAIPFAAFSEKSGARWKVTVRQPVINGERLLVVDFLNNLDCQSYRRETNSFRIVCGKKSEEVKGITHEGKVSDGVLNNFPRYGWEYIWISDEAEAAIARFTGTAKTEYQIDHLWKWIEKTRQSMLRRKRAERGEFQDEDYRLCPEGIPEGLVEYIRRTVLPEDNILVYKKGNVRGLCYQCGAEVRAMRKRFRLHDSVTCPNCGRKVMCVNENGQAYSSQFVDNIIMAQKGTDGETVFFRQWQLRRDPTANWERIEDFLHETARYAVKGRKSAKWQKEVKENHMYYINYRCALKEWTRIQGNHIYDGDYYFCPTGAEEALKGTAMQYADLQGYMQEKWDIVGFLRCHAMYPVTEFLWKNGYKEIVKARVMGMEKESRDAILWQRTKLKECFKFPLRYLKIRPPEDWTLQDVADMNIIWAKRGSKASEKEIIAMAELRKLGVATKDIEKSMNYTSAIKLANYLRKQKKEGRNIAVVFSDYLRECEQLQLDLQSKEILFPRDLYAAHERTMAQITFEKNRAEQEQFQQAVDNLEKFAWKKGDLLIRPARTQEELRDEGKELHHCVGGYIRQMANGVTAIFFIRKAAEADKPYFTLELQKKKVRQCRTDHNQSYEQFPEIKAFVEEWLKKIVEKGGVKKKEAAA